MTEPDRLEDIRRQYKPGDNEAIDHLLNRLAHRDLEVERQAQQIRDLQAEVNLLAAQQREAFGMADELDQAHAEVERLRGLLRRLAVETLLARAVIHELAWGDIVTIAEPRMLRDALRAWGEDDKVGTPELKRLAGEGGEQP